MPENCCTLLAHRRAPCLLFRCQHPKRSLRVGFLVVLFFPTILLIIKVRFVVGCVRARYYRLHPVLTGRCMPASDHGVLVAVRMGHAAAERDPPSRRLRLHRLGVQALVWPPPAQSTLRLAESRAPPRPLLDLQTLTKALCCWTCFSSLQQIARLIARNGYVAVLWRSALAPAACCLRLAVRADLLHC